MCADFGFDCRLFARRVTTSNISIEMGIENNMEAAENEPSNVDAPPKGKFVYILVLQLLIYIYCICHHQYFHNTCIWSNLTLRVWDPMGTESRTCINTKSCQQNPRWFHKKMDLLESHLWKVRGINVVLPIGSKKDEEEHQNPHFCNTRWNVKEIKLVWTKYWTHDKWNSKQFRNKTRY